MPKLALTDAAVKRLKAPATGQLDVFDEHYPGLCLRLGSRTRTWCYLTRVGKRLVRHRLGSYPAQSLAEARDLWRAAREQVQAGRPPRATPRSRDAIETVVADWLKRDQATNATHDEVKAAFERQILPAWSGRLITSIDRRDILELLDGVADAGKVGRARHLHAFLHRLFVWSIGRGILGVNPMAALPKPGEAVERERALSDAEIAALWRATKAISWPYSTITQLLLLTLARRDEINALRWEELDTAGACIRLPSKRVKNRAARVIHLEPLAWRLVHDGPRIQGSPYVFPSATGTTAPSGWSKIKSALDREMGCNEPWRLHDLRRTGATKLEKLGIPLAVTEAILGHTSGSKGGIVQVYQQHSYADEARAALARWAAHVLSVTG